MKAQKLKIMLCTVLLILIGFETLVFALENIVLEPSKIKESLAGEKKIIDLINKAGNADADETRLEFLLELSKMPDLEEQLRC